MKQILSHPDRPNCPGQIASAIRCDQWIYVSGQGPLDMKTLEYVSGTIGAETALTLRHIEKILADAGAKKSDIVKCTCYLADLHQFPGFHAAFGEFFEGGQLPARTTVQAPLLRGIQIEIDCIVHMP